MNTQIMNKIREIASKQTDIETDEYFNIYDACGGNFDDAYYIGIQEGQIIFARQLLSMMESNNEVEQWTTC